MIKFECNEASIEQAVFVGSMDTILAELCLQIGLIYSATAKANPMAGQVFKHKLIGVLIDPESQEHIFTDKFLGEAVDGKDKDSSHMCMSAVGFGDPEEFARQLKEILEAETEEDNESE